jgi:hypothetical protein
MRITIETEVGCLGSVVVESDSSKEAETILQQLLPGGDAERFNITVDQVAELIGHCMAAKKILAIKAVREMTGMGLKDAKELVDRNWVDFRLTATYKAGHAEGYSRGSQDKAREAALRASEENRKAYSKGYDQGREDERLDPFGMKDGSGACPEGCEDCGH